MSKITEKKESLIESLKKMFSLKEDKASHEESRFRLLDGGKVTGTNMCVLVCAMIVASVGLNTGSTAVIIGQTRADKVNTIIITLPSIYVVYAMATAQ